jgi:predicted RNA-binding protein associated with RNAse of E/G family
MSAQIVWPKMAAGTRLTIVKLDPDGCEVTRYPGAVIDAGQPHPWIAAQAKWVSRDYDLNGLLFIAGDTLHEFFSPVDWFNVFSVFSPEGELRGWYANVTYPARLDAESEPITLLWHDLYIDVIGLQDGRIAVRDEDELDQSGLQTSEPELHAKIITMRDEIVRKCAAREFPFHESALST